MTDKTLLENIRDILTRNPGNPATEVAHYTTLCDAVVFSRKDETNRASINDPAVQRLEALYIQNAADEMTSVYIKNDEATGYFIQVMDYKNLKKLTAMEDGNTQFLHDDEAIDPKGIDKKSLREKYGFKI